MTEIREKYNSFLLYGIFGGLLFITALFRDNYYCGLAGAVVFTVYYIFFILQNKRLFIKYIFLFFAVSMYVVGNFICDFIPTYLTELGVETYYVGSFSLLALYYYIFTLVLMIIDQKIESLIVKGDFTYEYTVGDKSISKLIMKYILPLIFTIGIIFFAFVAKKPSFAYGINRFAYAKNVLPAALNKMRTIPVLLAPIVFGYIIEVVQAGERKATIKKVVAVFVAYIPYIIFGFWIGNKFGLFWNLICAFVIPAVYYIDFDNINFFSFAKTILLVFIPLILIMLIFWFVRTGSIDAVIGKILVRVSQGGEIWWKEVASGDWVHWNPSALKQEFSDIWSSIASKGKIKNYGVYRVMDLYGSARYLSSYKDVDMRLSAQGFEMAFYCFGVISFFIFPVVACFILTIINNLYISAVIARSFSSVVYYRILLVTTTALFQGDWYRLFSTLDFLLYIVLFFILLVDRMIRKNTWRISENEGKV